MNLEDDRSWAAVAGWSDGAWVALEGDPLTVAGETHDPGRDGTYHDDLGIRAFLDTGWLKLVVEGQLGTRLEIPPDGMVDLHERMDPEDFAFALALVSLGVDRYEVSYLPDSGIIESWTAYVDGQVARRSVLSSVTAF
jgi:hypothetical protein